jgi:hypothetical protein
MRLIEMSVENSSVSFIRNFLPRNVEE